MGGNRIVGGLEAELQTRLKRVLEKPIPHIALLKGFGVKGWVESWAAIIDAMAGAGIQPVNWSKPVRSS